MKKMMTVLLTVVLCFSFCISSVCAANRVPEMEIEVALRPDGSAYITQTWSARTDEGTEFYLALNDSGYLSVTDFSVFDKDGPYTYIKDWDIEASFEEKARKCGIVETADGVELCWGISDYGENRYAIQYILHDLVGNYSDADGFYHRFIDEMDVFPTDVVLTIRNQDGTPLTDEICDIWGFGYEGQIAFEDGTIRAWSEEPLERGQNMTVMLSLEKGVLTPDRLAEGSFEEVKNRALNGSDYDHEDLPGEDVELTAMDYLYAAGFFGVVLLLLKRIFGSKKRRKEKQRKKLQDVEYFRDVPNDGNLNVSYHLGRVDNVCEEGSLLGAYFLRLIADGALEPVETGERAKDVSLKLIRPPRNGDGFEDVLYTVLEASSGADGILQPDELELYYRRNPRPLAAFMDSCKKNATRTMHEKRWLKRSELYMRRDLTDPGLEQLNQLKGLKRFLLDFSLIHERGVKETVLWQDYMIYAMLLGIADKVAPQLRELYPEAVPQIQRYERSVIYATHYNRALYSAYRSNQQRSQKARSSGSGGRVSRGGGGGFSGGGRGGTR